MTTVSYPFDSTGRASTNLVTNEPQVLTRINGDAFRIFIPNYAPFYRTNFKVVGRDALGNSVPLTEGKDFNFIMKYIGATRANGSIVYGGIAILNQAITGTVTTTYQTMGGKYSADRGYVVQTIAENNYNPRRVAWDQVTSIQETFPPSPHPQDLDTFTGYKDLVDAVNRIQAAVAQNNPLENVVWKHILDLNDPHKTKNHFPSDLATIQDVNSLIAQNSNIYDNVPTTQKQGVIVVNKPHRRMMVWVDTKYERAPWDQPGILKYSYANVGTIPGHLPVRADVSYRQIDYPDLVKRLGLPGSGTFVLQEMRGEFLRVLDNGRGVDVARQHLSWQAAKLLRHTHTGVAADAGEHTHASLTEVGFDVTNGGETAQGSTLKFAMGDNWPYAGSKRSMLAGTHSHPIAIDNAGDDEGAPRNIAVPLWISY